MAEMELGEHTCQRSMQSVYKETCQELLGCIGMSALLGILKNKNKAVRISPQKYRLRNSKVMPWHIHIRESSTYDSDAQSRPRSSANEDLLTRRTPCGIHRNQGFVAISSSDDDLSLQVCSVPICDSAP